MPRAPPRAADFRISQCFRRFVQLPERKVREWAVADQTLDEVLVGGGTDHIAEAEGAMPSRKRNTSGVLQAVRRIAVYVSFTIAYTATSLKPRR
jgi:hypothetical protein